MSDYDYEVMRGLTHEVVTTMRARRVPQYSKWTRWTHSSHVVPMTDDLGLLDEQSLAAAIDEHWNPEFIGPTEKVIERLESIGWEFVRKKWGLKYDSNGRSYIMSHPSGILYVKERQRYYPTPERGATEVVMRKRQKND